jgi:hypothetical protein
MNTVTLHVFTNEADIEADSDKDTAFARWNENFSDLYTRYFTIAIEVPDVVPQAKIVLPVEPTPSVTLS